MNLDHPDWLTPRGSISSMVSIGLQNFVFNSDLESEEDEDEEEVRSLEIYIYVYNFLNDRDSFFVVTCRL